MYIAAREGLRAAQSALASLSGPVRDLARLERPLHAIAGALSDLELPVSRWTKEVVPHAEAQLARARQELEALQG
jgi:hypothetical protein